MLDAQDAELERITRQRRTLEQARVEAEREMEAAARREAERRRAKDEREAAKLSAEARQVAERLDAGIVQCASDALELERLLVQASRLRGGGPNVHARIERAVRGAYWHRGLKVGDFTRPDMRGPLVEGLGALLGVAKKERAA